jgi:CRP-like cAMP-binding protein
MINYQEEIAREQLRAAVRSLIDIKDMDMKEFTDIFHLSYIPKKQIIINAGESSDNIYFISKGIARVYYIKEDKEITNWVIEENNFFAATYSLFTGQQNNYIYEALEDLTVLIGSYTNLQKMYSMNHDYEHIGRKMVEHYYSIFLKKSYDIMFLSAEDRYQVLLDQHPEWMNRIPLKTIASYLGMTQETLSRMRAK